ncbi:MULTISPECIES: hypothetical protein [unclassified Actinomyces]|uniref:hypothetical protein n=1 Tax=unclassified Actinomyces TaxID=2609248 RepID=UPI002017E6D1|nr:MULTISPECIES: hypothetical protein [unclassified Actinomyces]MCL3777733.1 hypothetical protein [Actinomyces sp. AC-20-1]MCL3790462.1 hypothetical protein [Actinomyces sp. 187325]MCL3792921.1 hypothetical protein [Actinomyces sp. 186855]MCL3795218.1 hypothetical protein [Actinomyces sp. 217892]
MSSTLRRRVFGLGALSVVAAAGLAACGSSGSEDPSTQSTSEEMAQAPESAAEEKPASEDVTSVDNHVIVFEVTSTTATTADITMTSIDANGSLSQEQLTDEGLPFSKTLEIDGALTIDVSAANILAQVKDGTDVTVSMTIDDGEPLTATGEGEFATAMVQGDSAGTTQATAGAGL